MAYSIRLPDGTSVDNIPDEVTPEAAKARILQQRPELFGTQKPAKDAGFSLKDLGVAFGQGVVGSTKSLTDVAGAGNVASEALEGASKSLQGMLSPERQAEMQRQQERMKKAEASGSTWEEIKAGVQNVTEAPLQSIAQGVGSFVPYLPAMLASPAAAALRLGPGAVRAVAAVADVAPKVIGTAQGAGTVKGAIYDGVYQAEKEAGATEQAARQKATAAQEYFGKNFDQIALGAGLGLGAASTGVEKLLTPSGKAAAQQGIGRRVAGAMAAEAPMEGAQGGQERLAANIAQQREGYDVDTMKGVVGQAVQEGLVGALSAGPVAALRGPEAAAKVEPPPAEEEKRLALGMEKPFIPTPLPDGSVAMTREDLARYEEEQFQKKYAPQEAEKPYAPGPSLTGMDMAERLAQRPGGGGLADIMAARRMEAEDARVEEARRARVAPESAEAGRNVLRTDRGNEDLMAVMAERRAVEDAAAQKEAQRLARVESQQAKKQAALLGEVESPMMASIRERKAAQEAADAAAAKAQEQEAKKEEEAKYAVSPSVTKTPMPGMLGGAPAGGDLATMIRTRREEQEAKAEVPLDDDYAFLQREKQRLMSEEKSPQSKLMLERIDERMGEILKRDIENMRKDKEKAAASVFGEENLPPVEERGVVVGNKEISELQAPTLPSDETVTGKEARQLRQFEKQRTEPAPVEDAQARLEQAEMERRKFLRSKDAKDGNLLKLLEGKLSPDEVSDIAPKGKGFEKLANKNGTYISELISSGLLDDFLPPDERVGMTNFDAQKSAETIKEKLRNKDPFSFDRSVALRQINDQIASLEQEVKQPSKTEFDVSEVEPGEAASIDRSLGDVRFKRSTGTSTIGKPAVDSVVDAVKSRWKNAPETVVAENMDDPVIPQEVRDHNAKQVKGGAKGSPQGFFYKGKAYVIADKIGSVKEAVEALMHEALGHYGLRGVFGSKMESVLNDVIKHRRAEVEGKAEQYGLDPKNKADLLEAAEEVLAVMAQTKPGLPFVKRAIAIIRNFLRDLGFNVKMTDADIIQKYILPARAFVESGKGRAVEGKPAASREEVAKADPTTEAFKRWFGDSKVVDANGKPQVMYHGTMRDFDSFDPDAEAATEKTGIKAIYVSPDTEFANQYADGRDGRVMPVYVKAENPFDFDNANHIEALQDYEKANRYTDRSISNYVGDVKRGWWEAMESRRVQAAIKSMGHDGFYLIENGVKNLGVYAPAQIKSATGNKGTYDAKNPDIRFKRSEKPTPNQAGKEALGILESTGMQLPPVEPGQIERLKAAAKSAVEDPALTSASAKKAIVKFLDKMEVAAFSGDAAFNNDIRRNLIADLNEHPEVMGMLLEASQSQAVHSDALASQFIIDGGIAYDKEAKKWVSVKKEDNFIALAKKIDKVATKYGLTKEQAERVAHTYFVAKRFKSLLAKQRGRESEIARLEDELASENASIKKYAKENDYEKVKTSERAKNDIKSEIKKLKEADVLITPDQIALIDSGMSLAENMPELKDISDTWQGIRVNAIKAMVDGGLWSMEQSESMLDNIDYVPFYREEQLEEGGGPQEFVKGLQVKSKEYRLKGSGSPVNDVFDNMVRWTQYAINRSVRNHKALQMVDIGTDLQVGDGKMAEKVEKMDPKLNTIRVFRNGTQEIYSMADPLYVDAFSSISNVTIPSLKFFTWFSNLLRESVVLYPLFSVAQVPQDAISAMFSSGLKPQYALRIPVMAAKEFIKTLNKSSATHNLLKSYGATGVRDFSAAVARKDIEIAAGLKAQKGLGGRIKEGLSHIAMAADNSVRQAVYDASVAQGLSKAEALEKSFDIINFRRRGTSKMINLMGQVVPFFYAYMSVQRTAYKTITGVGISPQKRKEAMKTLAATSGAVMALALFYTMMNAGDDEYEKTPTAVRDRTLNIPGTGGFRIPLRPDLFLFPKVITEHLYHMITDDGLSDGAKFRKSVADGMANAVLSPQPIPQAIKPAFEVAINYDFFQGRPLIGQFEKQKEAERQFNDNTSEFSKMLGQFGVSPIAADHVIRGMFGSAGGLFLYGTNFMLNSDPDVPRPELSVRDAMAALPGTSGFVTKASENALKNDFFALRDEVEKTKNTYNDIKMRSPQELEQFLSDEKNIARLGLAKGTEKIGMQLSKIRRAITQITNAPSDLYSASEKASAIKELRQVEKDMLKSIDLGGMRKQAQL